MKGELYGRFTNYILYVVSFVGLCFGSFFNNATMYLSLSSSTPVLNSEFIENDYKYSAGLRKMALFGYQDRERFYTGSESSLTDKATIGAVNGWEYLFNVDATRNRGLEFLDSHLWLKWSNEKFITRFKYTHKESRDLQFIEADFRWRKTFLWFDFTSGYAIKGHPVYGHPAILDYDGAWWELAYNYGYTDYMIPENDLNDNGIIDYPYYVWIETDEETLERYWILFNEGINYYWEDSDSNYVAGSDQEFYDYHYSSVVDMYNEDNKDKSWQVEGFIVVGLDMYLGSENFYTHLWVNSYPKSFGFTDKAYDGDDVQYDVGLLLGTNLSEHIGVYIEGNKQNFYGKEEYDVKLGFNYKF